jgi:diguanylate cyclase (GGDEF)-like protein/PAS domain S-box-containing protein
VFCAVKPHKTHNTENFQLYPGWVSTRGAGEGVMQTILLAAVTLMQLATAGLLLRQAGHFPDRRPWFLGAGVLLASSVLTGAVIVMELTGALGLSLSTGSSLSLVIVSALILAGAYWGAGQLASVHRSLESLKVTSNLDQAVFENTPQLLALKNPDGEYVQVNRAFSQFLGKELQAIQGHTAFDLFPRSQASALSEGDREAIEAGGTTTEQAKVTGLEGEKWLEIIRTPIYSPGGEPDWVLVSARDITHHKQRQDELHQRALAIENTLEAVAELAAQTETQSVLDASLAWSRRLVKAPEGLAAMTEEGGAGLQVYSASPGLSSLQEPVLKPGEGLISRILQTGEPLMVNQDDPWTQRDPFFKEAGFTAALGAPLENRSGVVGVLCLFHNDPERRFNQQDLEVLKDISDVASQGLESARAKQELQHNLTHQEDKAKRLEDHYRQARILAAIAAHFIHTPADKIKEGIDHALQTLGQLNEVDRAYLALFSQGGQTLETIGEWSTARVEPLDYHLGDLDLEGSDWWMGKLNRLEIIHIPRLDELPPEAHQTRQFLDTHGVKSLTAIPLVSNRSLIGYLGFDSERKEHDFSPTTLALQKITADMFVNLLERKQALEELHAARERRDQQMVQLEQRNRQNRLIAELGDLLLVARTADEAYPIISRYAQRLMPATAGALYLIDGRSEAAERVLSWGETEPRPEERELTLSECWALRRGRLHLVTDVTADPVCAHLSEPLPEAYICAPLNAQGETMGLLHVRFSPEDGEPRDYRQLARMLAEHTALALSNLSLRDRLRSQAIRDPLTGLFNRRYMEATLDRELRRAHRHGTSVGIMMFDVDHLKPINDTHGHDAGDALLKALGELMMKMFRGEDVACRFGGDEFTIILPEASLADIWGRAEQLREQFKDLNLEHNGGELGETTISIGVAAYPEHGRTVEELLQVSDAAAYLAKAQGGDRVMIGRTGDESV